MPTRRLHAVLVPALLVAALLTPTLARAEGTSAPSGSWGCPGACAPLPDCTCRADYEVSLDLDLSSMYVWRGLRVVDGFVAQPALDFSVEGFGLNVWANLDLEDMHGNQGKFTEVDLTGSYACTLDRFEFQVGAVTYLFPTGGEQTTELFAGVSLDVPLTPTLTVYQDIDVVEGTYLALSGSWTFDDPFCLGSCRGVSPELSASIGWGSKDHNEVYYGDRASGLADLTLALRVPYRLTRVTTLAASAYWSSLLDDGIRDAVDEPDSLWFSLSVSVSF